MSADDALSPSLDSTIGVELIGFGIALALFGITTAQTITYWLRYGPGRTLVIRPCLYMVSALWVIGSVHVVMISYVIWSYLVLQRGDPDVFIRPPWTIAAIIIISESNSILVRFGYAYRIWRYTGRKRLVPCIILVTSIFILATNLGMIFVIPSKSIIADRLRIVFCSLEVHLQTWLEGRRFQWTLYAAFSCQILIDGWIAFYMCLVLRRFKTGLQRLDLVIKAILMYVVNTGFLTAVGVLFGIIFFVTQPASFVFIGIYFTLPKLYTCAFLGVLNAEQRLIRQTSGEGFGTPVPVLSSAVRIGSSTFIWEEDETSLPPDMSETTC
ncbi:hypothetical protein ONZ51_g4552 [Trametes cubensis]|uniref:DUF6534 domain-containing protein n=1 Tax=Trametes cubensis TaxID=1111947 RepID=A0AAD7TVT7_9APHY|nr:hypothetical protein ONZ51_g4552 [Trametes cubensis]